MTRLKREPVASKPAKRFIKYLTKVITFGLFWFVINAAMLELASAIVPGFEVRSFWAAFWGAVVLSLVNMLLRWLVRPPRDVRS